MADTTTVMALPYPEGSDANDVPADMQALAERLDEVPGIESLTSAEISGLAAGEKPAGRVVYNSTTSKLQVSNGSAFANVDAAALLLAGGTMAGNIAMGSNKVTGLAAASSNGDAVRYEQALLLAGGTMSGNINANGNKVTGLAAATANGDAVRYEQATPVYAVGTRDSALTLAAYSSTTITYTAETDPSSMLNASTGIITLPSAGVWSISGSIIDSNVAIGTSPSRLALYHGADAVAYQSLSQVAAASAHIVAAASDTVKMAVFNDGASKSCMVARFTVAKIGL